jgi:hypothetical protein
MQYTSFAKDLPSFDEESPSLTKELPSIAEYFFLGRLGHRVFTGYSVAVFPTLMQYILPFMLRNLFELTYLQKDTYCSSSCPGGYYAKQTVSGNWQCHQCYQGSGCYPYYTCLTSAQKEITTNAPHAIPALFSIPTPEVSASILAPTVSGEVSYLN